MKTMISLFILLGMTMTFSQTYKFVTDEKKNKQMAVGIITKEVFSDTAFVDWFKLEYNDFECNVDLIEKITPLFKTDIKITICMGTWCGDSHEQIPRFYRIIENCGFSESNLTVYALDRKKEAGNYNIKELKIELVPTIIFYRKGAEIGRIIETPKETLEKDILEILSK